VAPVLASLLFIIGTLCLVAAAAFFYKYDKDTNGFLLAILFLACGLVGVDIGIYYHGENDNKFPQKDGVACVIPEVRFEVQPGIEFKDAIDKARNRLLEDGQCKARIVVTGKGFEQDVTK
jgi:hypothetical protein